MRSQKILLTAALGLIMSAVMAPVAPAQAVSTQAAKSISTPIPALPFNITAPGTYVLTSDLASTGSFTQVPSGAINVVQNIAGTVVIDLKGFTITGLGDFNPQGVLIEFNNFAGPSAYPITVRNGTIKGFFDGMQVLYQDNVTINNIVFYEPAEVTVVGFGVAFFHVNLSTIGGVPPLSNTEITTPSPR